MLRSTLPAAALALAACAPASETAPLPAPRAIFDAEGATIDDARGVWRAPDYGWILEIDETGIDRWQDAPAACYRARPSETAQFMGRIEFRYLTPARSGADFRYPADDEPVAFERLDALPERCVEREAWSETDLFELFASIMAEHYAFFDARNLDWTARNEAARAGVFDGMGEAALFAQFQTLMTGLSDSHTKLIADIDGERLRVQDGQGLTLPRIRETLGETPWLIGLVQQLLGEVLEDGRFIGNDRIIAGSLPTENGARVGYVLILTMGGFDESEAPGSEAWAAAERAAFAQMMDEIIGGFADHEAVIIDLSNNRGGYDAIARDLAARFTDTPFEAYQVWPGSAPDNSYRHTIQPAEGARFTGPVAVLTSDVTVSGGEIATLALRQLDHVVQAGGTSRGAFSTPLAKPLPNGWYLELSSEVYADPEGQVFEETGLTPDWHYEVYPESAPIAGHAENVRALAERLVRD